MVGGRGDCDLNSFLHLLVRADHNAGLRDSRGLSKLLLSFFLNLEQRVGIAIENQGKFLAVKSSLVSQRLPFRRGSCGAARYYVCCVEGT